MNTDLLSASTESEARLNMAEVKMEAENLLEFSEAEDGEIVIDPPNDCSTPSIHQQRESILNQPHQGSQGIQPDFGIRGQCNQFHLKPVGQSIQPDQRVIGQGNQPDLEGEGQPKCTMTTLGESGQGIQLEKEGSGHIIPPPKEGTGQILSLQGREGQVNRHHSLNPHQGRTGESNQTRIGGAGPDIQPFHGGTGQGPRPLQDTSALYIQPNLGDTGLGTQNQLRGAGQHDSQHPQEASGQYFQPPLGTNEQFVQYHLRGEEQLTQFNRRGGRPFHRGRALRQGRTWTSQDNMHRSNERCRTHRRRHCRACRAPLHIRVQNILNEIAQRIEELDGRRPSITQIRTMLNNANF